MRNPRPKRGENKLAIICATQYNISHQKEIAETKDTATVIPPSKSLQNC